MPRAKRFKIWTWDNDPVAVAQGQVQLEHLGSMFYTADVGFSTLAKLKYAVAYRKVGNRDKKYAGHTSVYGLLRHTHSTRRLQEQTKQDRTRGLAYSKPRSIVVRILVKRLPREGVNIPMHRYIYQLMAMYLLDKDTGDVIDVDVVDDYVRQFHRQVTARVIAPMLQQAREA